MYFCFEIDLLEECLDFGYLGWMDVVYVDFVFGGGLGGGFMGEEVGFVQCAMGVEEVDDFNIQFLWVLDIDILQLILFLVLVVSNWHALTSHNILKPR